MSQGAWQEWLYDILIEEAVSNKIEEIANISKTSCDLHQLKPNTVYKISVRASSKAGKGPWSSAFVGSTLKSVNKKYDSPSILWATKSGRLLQSDLTADTIEPVLNAVHLNKTIVKDLCWYKDLVLLNLNNTSVIVYNKTNQSMLPLKSITSVKTMAIDWLTPKLYWSNDDDKMIMRSSLGGNQREIVRLMTEAKQLAIDALSAKLYWITDLTVECSQLNGRKHKTFFKVENFFGKQVMGLTLDLDHMAIFWVVRYNNDYFLYKVDLITEESFGNPIQLIKSTSPSNEELIGGSLWYFNNRFFVHHFNSILVTDLKGRNAAFLRLPEKVETIEIIDHSIHQIPNQIGHDINVIPNAVNASSVFLDVLYDKYTLYWKEVSNVNYGDVFYEVIIKQDYDSVINVVTNLTQYVYSINEHQTYSPFLRVVIKSMTYWATSAPTVVDLSLDGMNVTGTVLPSVAKSLPSKTRAMSKPMPPITSIQHSSSSNSYILYIVITFLCAIIVTFVVLIFHKIHKDKDEKKVLREADIVTLNEIPPHLSCENNAHYLNGDVYLDEDLSSIPKISSKDWKITRILGSGAFATVYEGVVCDSNGKEIKIAIKDAKLMHSIQTIRDTATEQNRNDFLKEAKLMRNFKHKHILQLFGICLEKNPILIFELMAGGDLLSYLRKHRPEIGKQSALNTNDLFSICIDVAKGCKYLEEMHYVHRDLAARNCLVSSHSRNDRVVKIGDFGLARDIYKNDYYRKAGEGLLP
ncbi:proto-oncogene tyrosine-protein kinase ROS-like isoform X1, partial [Leptotrombidium deliense]